MYYNGKTEAGGDVALQTDRSSTDEATACDLMDEGHNIFKRRKLWDFSFNENKAKNGL